MADRDPKPTVPGGSSPSPARLVGWTVVGALSGLVLYRTANDIVMGQASWAVAVAGAVSLAVALFAVTRLARLLA